ncbi:transposase (plasmid) [Variovorax sp. PDNC026]|uniref:transposase n=1 Tax=Variovorax sp. PDNC026 TaxID=2811425 RepID=UPI0019622A10|nr:transposase [Variovorax sp. PDNC026]QRY35529.1 transposase [Variovorax sp. PDNC026]
MTDTRKSRCTAERIIGFIKRAEAGLPVKGLRSKGGLSDTTFHKWRAKYAGMEVPDAERLRELEAENNKLEKLLLGEGHLAIHALNTAFGVER